MFSSGARMQMKVGAVGPAQRGVGVGSLGEDTFLNHHILDNI